MNNGGCGMRMCTNQPGAAAVCGGAGAGSGGGVNLNCTGIGDVYGCDIDGVTRPAPSDSTLTTPTMPMPIGTLSMPVSRSLGGWSVTATVASSSAGVGKNGSEGTRTSTSGFGPFLARFSARPHAPCAMLYLVTLLIGC